MGQDMLHVGTKKILVCYACSNVIFNGVLKLAGTVKIRDGNQEMVDTVFVMVGH